MVFKDITGKRYGSFLVEKKLCKREDGKVVWLCICDCGNTRNITTSELNAPRGTKSCGCSRKVIGENNKKWTGYKEIPGKYFTRIQSECKRGKTRVIEFDITIEQIWELFLKQDRKCALTKRDIHFNAKSYSERTASLDRIDSSKGYVIGNVQWVHKDLNNMKQDYSQKYFIDMCKLVAENSKC